MNEQANPAPSPEQVLRRKDEVQTHFEQLPPEHQATFILVLLSSVMDGEWGTWMKEALRLRWGVETDPDSLLYPVTSISVEDLDRVLAEEEWRQFSPADMGYIAHIMEDRYVEAGFWDDLQHAADQVLEQKRQTDTDTQSL